MKNEKVDSGYTMEDLLTIFPEKFLHLDPEEQAVSIRTFELLSLGKPVSISQLSEATNLSKDRINNIFDGWPGVFRNDNSDIIAYWGLGLKRMPHQIKFDDVLLYNWCAWDSLFIPALIGKTAQVESSCPVTNEKISLTVSQDGFEIEPKEAMMSFVRPDSGITIDDNVISNFCHKIYFFASGNAASEWVAENPATFVISIEDAFSLGQRRNRIRYNESKSSS